MISNMQFLGIDTSNYTTSVAIYDDNSEIVQQKKLLPVKKGERGLRQSDAVFHHTQQLPIIIQKLSQDIDIKPTAIGVSTTPRPVKGSYMPCFTVGSGFANSLANILNVPLYTFSHQEGHIVAALYSADRLDLLSSRFLAFHISGGTTEALLVTGDGNGKIDIQLVANTLDLNAGQVIDRVGVELGLDFPCGKGLEKLALDYNGKLNFKPTLKGLDCCLSGVENQCKDMINRGISNQEVSAYCLLAIEKTLTKMCEGLIQKYGDLPILFAGGVMSNTIIRNNLERRFNAIFAKPEFSADNAAGIAVLTKIKWRTQN